jgi:di/tricarboxylate transporter
MSFFIIGNGKDKVTSLLRNSLPNMEMCMFPCAKASQIISSALIATASDVNGIDMDVENTSSRTELDSHANMVVVGNNCSICFYWWDTSIQ